MTETQSDQRRVVVGVDGSDSSKRALRYAHRIAEAEGVPLDVIGAWEYPVTWGTATIPTDYSPQHDMEKVLVEVVDEVFGADRPASLRLYTREGDAGRVLIQESKTALLLAVGSRGVGGFMGLLLGSVSEKVAEHATCPVLVVHEKKEHTS